MLVLVGVRGCDRLSAATLVSLFIGLSALGTGPINPTRLIYWPLYIVYSILSLMRSDIWPHSYGCPGRYPGLTFIV